MTDPAAILVRLTGAQRDQVKLAARRMGVSLGAFCAQAIMECVDRTGGNGKMDLAGQVAAIYQKVCVGPAREVPAAVLEAADALTQLGWQHDQALKRIEKMAKAMPDADAEALLAEALKRKD